VMWWQTAADQGIAIAQLNLSVMYANGDGVEQDYVKSHMYANLAAAHLPLGEDREIAIKNRDVIAKTLTPAQIAEAQRLAREWRPKDAD
jgi:TPR repeat protein